MELVDLKKMELLEGGWIKVLCPKCEGHGTCPEPDWWMHPNQFKAVTCWWCKGNRILLARPVEFKKDVDTSSDKKETA